MKYTLKRKLEVGEGTYGIISIAGQQFATVEPLWRDGLPNISCIPCGVYDMVRDTFRDKPVIALINTSIGVYNNFIDMPYKYSDDEDVRKKDKIRFRCLIHPINFPSETKGCIGVGIKHAATSGDVMVVDSAKSLAMLMADMDENDNQLEIINSMC